MWANQRIENRFDCAAMDRRVAALGARLAAALTTLYLSIGCGVSHVSDETVQEKDKMRKEAAKKMPGNDVPLDPADE